MSIITTIELKEKQGKSNDVNGSWYNILAKPVYIEENDIISVDKVFVDSSPQNSQSIFIKNDMTIEFSCYLYNNNITGTQKTYQDSTAVDGAKYIMCSKKSVTPGDLDGFEEVLNVGFYSRRHEANWGGFTAFFNYIDTNNELAHHSIVVTQTPYEQQPFAITFPINIIAKKDTFVLTAPTLAEIYDLNTVYSPPTKGPITAEDIYTPIIQKKSIILKKGNYDPIFVAKHITDNITKSTFSPTNPAKPFLPVQNPFLQSSGYIDVANTHFINCEIAGGSFLFNVVPNTEAGMWFGSSQISLLFDSEQHFYWGSLHTSLYSDQGQKITKFVPYLNQYIPVSSSGGIFINNIKCSDIENPNIPFFQNELGFDMGTLCPKIKMTDTVINSVTSKVPILNLEAGVNFTEGLLSIDGGIQKNSASEVCPTTVSLENAIQDQTTQIYSQSVAGDLKNSVTGYYQIEIGSTFHNEFIGDTVIKNNIQSIVSKYFTNNSYTSGESNSGIPYQHHGEPTQLKAFNIRVLDSNGNMAQDLGNDNTVILRITKQNQNQKQKK